MKSFKDKKKKQDRLQKNSEKLEQGRKGGKENFFTKKCRYVPGTGVPMSSKA